MTGSKSVFADRREAGAAGAEIAAGIMRAETERAGRAAVVFASAVSQDAFLAALRAALKGPVVEACPASALRRHPSAILFLDPAAASLL